MDAASKWRWYAATLLLIASAMGLSAQGPSIPYSPPPQPSNGAMTPMAVAGQLIADAKTSFARVRDYAGLLYRQERVNGELMPEQKIEIQVRQQPFSIHMKWLSPAKNAGQEAVYVAGKYNNQMRAKAGSGLVSAFGFVTLDPRDPKVMNGNRHAITECGLGNMIEQIVQGYETERKVSPEVFAIAFGEYKFLQKTCTRVESVRRVNNGQFYCHRTVVYYDRETRLPVRFEAYDWPRPGSPPGGDLLECYSYVDLRFNLNLTDASFNY